MANSAETAPVGVVVPVFNRRLKLIRTLATVAAQTTKPERLIVVDDGSTDGSGDAAESWLAHNAPFDWRVLRQTNSGVSAARNAGFAHVDDLPFVCFLDSDDLWPQEFLSEGLRALAGRNDAVAAVTDRVFEVKGKRRAAENLHALTLNPILWIVCNGGGILSGTIIRTRAAHATGLFVPGMVASEDVDFLFKLFQSGGAVRSEASPVVYVRRSPLETTEPANLSKPSPELLYLWARCMRACLSELPESFLRKHDRLIRTAMARRWANAAFSSAQAKMRGRALSCLLRALWCDRSWERGSRLIELYRRGGEPERKRALKLFATPLGDGDAVAR